jgi:putative hemolysin
MAEPQPQRIFTIPNPFSGGPGRRLFGPVGRALDRVLGLDGINAVYNAAAAWPLGRDRSFLEQVIDVLGITTRLEERDVDRIPRTGPLVVVANHCYGGVEGILAGALVQSVRPDTRVMANYMLARMPELREQFIFVDPFGRSGSVGANARAMRESLRWLRGGGCLVVFPSGEVAHYDLRRRSLVEPPWNRTVAGLIRRSDATVLPMFFFGTNSVLFHVLGYVHPRLRTLRLPREVLNKRGRTVAVSIGHPIAQRRLAALDGAAAVMDYLRMRTYHLRNRRARRPRLPVRLPLRLGRPGGPRHEDALIDPIPRAELEREIAVLPPEQRLLTQDVFDVWVARAIQAPRVLREIGRLRELTFRLVGEGTGKSVDLDAYDAAYLHLFIWNRAAGEIASAYRLGPTDIILPRSGRKGLYTYCLFRYGNRLLERINPALEMGRSFVRPEYQRNYLSLYLLWKGIGQYLVRNPRYKILFGPVSISDNYNSRSRDLLVSFLRMNNYMPDLARLVRARTPLRRTVLRKVREDERRHVVDSVEEVEALIADIETELSGIPILLKQYLKLGGKLLGFNLDPAFGNVLDGLILVDVTQTNRKVLNRYLGGEGMRSYLAYWQQQERDANAAGT